MGNFKAKATEYDGIVFRSRLEAMYYIYSNLIFDETFEGRKRATIEYEPIQLKGWNPDFLITLPAGHKILVEVKPSTFDFEIDRYFSALRGTEYSDLWLFSPDNGILVIEFMAFFHTLDLREVLWKQAQTDLYYFLRNG